jgi:hypothetical protein
MILAPRTVRVLKIPRYGGEMTVIELVLWRSCIEFDLGWTFTNWLMTDILIFYQLQHREPNWRLWRSLTKYVMGNTSDDRSSLPVVMPMTAQQVNQQISDTQLSFNCIDLSSTFVCFTTLGVTLVRIRMSLTSVKIREWLIVRYQRNRDLPHVFTAHRWCDYETNTVVMPMVML